MNIAGRAGVSRRRLYCRWVSRRVVGRLRRLLGLGLYSSRGGATNIDRDGGLWQKQ